MRIVQGVKLSMTLWGIIGLTKWGRMRAVSALLALSVVVALSGCASTSDSSVGESAPAVATTAAARKAQSEPTTQDIVSFLGTHCSGANGSIILEPSAWKAIGQGAASGSKRYQLDLSGYEDYEADYIVAIDLTPSESGTALAMAPEYAQDTNFELSAWGCDFASDPNAGSSVDNGDAPMSNEQSMPDLYGLSGDTVQQEVWSAGYQFHVVREFTTFNPPSACLGGVSGVGMVVDQSVSAGTTFEDSQSYTVWVTIDCDYQF